MINLLKSKFFLGVMVVAIMFVGAFALGAEKASADCTIYTTLRIGSVGIEVQCLQTKVGAVADGKFGPMTLASVKAWQASHGLVADGIVGPLTRAALNAQGSVVGNLPLGCTSTVGYSPLTGVRCDSSITNLPAGCTSTVGYSPTTGVKCDSNIDDDDDDDSPSQGGAGDITLTLRGTYSNEEVGEGEEDAKVLAVDVEADQDSDVELNSVKVEFHQATAADDRD